MNIFKNSCNTNKSGNNKFIEFKHFSKCHQGNYIVLTPYIQLLDVLSVVFSSLAFFNLKLLIK